MRVRNIICKKHVVFLFRDINNEVVFRMSFKEFGFSSKVFWLKRFGKWLFYFIDL